MTTKHTLVYTLRAIPIVLAASGVFYLAPRPATAQETVDNTAAARALFEQGLELLEEERWEEAADRFQRAQVLRPSPQITYNLTTALVELGRLVRATELLRQVTLDPDVEPEIREVAEGRRAQLLPRLATLTVEVPDELGAADLYLNEQRLETVLRDVPFPVDPGDHVLSARRDGEVLVTLHVNLAEGEERTVRLEPPPPPQPPQPPQPSEPPEHQDEELSGDETGDGNPPGRSSMARRWWLWTIVGTVVVASGLGLGLGLGLQDRQADPIDGLGGTLFVGGDE